MTFKTELHYGFDFESVLKNMMLAKSLSTHTINGHFTTFDY